MPPLGEVGDDDPPPQAENSVASVAQPAAWQAPVQNWRRETVLVSDIAVIIVWRAVMPAGRCARSRPHIESRRFLNRI